MQEWLVYATPGDVFDDLAANHALLREAETRELALIAEACDAYLVDEFGADAACEKLIRGGADGTPLVGEFLALELAGLLHTSAASAATRIAEVLNLRHRHPELWERVAAGRVEAFKALEVARRCAQAGLSLEAARWVDHQLALCLVGLPWGRAMRLLEGYITKADPVLAAERAERRRTLRGVVIGDHRDGAAEVWARLDSEDALALDDTLNDLSTALVAAGSTETSVQSRATALGVLADPARALTLLSGVDHGSRARQATLFVHIAADTIYGDWDQQLVPAPWNGGASSLQVSGDPPDPAHEIPTSGGELCPLPGAVGRSVPGVRLADEGLGRPVDLFATGVARIEKIGPLDTVTLRRFLSGCQVTVRPVIDLNTTPAVDAYEVPDRLRQLVAFRNPVEAFPYSNTLAARCDDDHTIPYDFDAPGGALQTRHDNLAPLSRKAHRAKTSKTWQYKQTDPGVLLITTKLGYRYEVTADGTTPLGRVGQSTTAPDFDRLVALHNERDADASPLLTPDGPERRTVRVDDGTVPLRERVAVMRQLRAYSTRAERAPYPLRHRVRRQRQARAERKPG